MPGPWFLYNLDTDEEITGQFEIEDLTETVGNTYAENWALNRQTPITQYAHGNTRTMSFSATFWLKNPGFYGFDYGQKEILEPFDRLEALKVWTQRDDDLRRPPILMFWVGDSAVGMDYCVIESLSNIQYIDFEAGTGKPKHIVVTINLREYTPLELEFSEGTGDTRYHRAKRRDYYEMLCFKEYKNPMLGDVIRKRHPTKANIQTGDVIKLPTASVLRTEKTKPASIPLKDAFTKKTSVQKTRRLEALEDRNVTYTSHVLTEY